MTKRQKIGRGLRICVNQDGDRVNEPKFNILSVVANESYKDFASGLQRELESDAGYKFGIIEKVSFAGMELTTPYGIEITLTQEDSAKIHTHLKNSGYLKSNGKIEDKFFSDVQNNEFRLPNEYSVFKDKIIEKIRKLSREIEIKDANNKIKVSIREKAIQSAAFKEMWNKIKHKTLYSVEMDIERFKEESIDKLKDMSKIVSEKLTRERTELNITSGGVIQEGATRYGAVADINEFDMIIYPDFIRRLQDSTQLLRSTIIEIIRESGRLSDFYVNPETFIKNVSTILNQVKKTNLTKGLKYYQTDEFFVQEEIFDDTELYGYKNKNIIDISNKKITTYMIMSFLIQ